MDDKLTPCRAIRATCVDCVGSVYAVKDCEGDRLHGGPCPFSPYRIWRGKPSVKLIRKHCLWCMGGGSNPRTAYGLVENCPSLTYPLLPYLSYGAQAQNDELSP